MKISVFITTTTKKAASSLGGGLRGHVSAQIWKKCEILRRGRENFGKNDAFYNVFLLFFLKLENIDIHSKIYDKKREFVRCGWDTGHDPLEF